MEAHLRLFSRHGCVSVLAGWRVSCQEFFLHAERCRASACRAGMLNRFALSAVTGLLALFGLNEANPFPRVRLSKVRGLPKSALALNGQLFAKEDHDVRSTPTPAPEATHELYGVEVSGPSNTARFAANAAAKQTLLAPIPDLALLRAYSGGGGIGESVDQFYTPTRLGQLLWDAVTPSLKLDDDKKPVRALEPSCGNGSLLAHAPEGVLLIGVEYDPTAAKAAQLLHPHAAVHSMPFERYAKRSSDALFDVVIANPPYGPRGETRDLHEPNESRSERYFMQQILARTQFQTGLVSVLLPIALLHGATHQSWREALLKHALPIHAAVVPTGAFKDAGAGVTTALLILRRHDHGVAEALSTLTAEQVTDVLFEYATDSWHRQFLRHFADGRGLIETSGSEGNWTHKLRLAVSAFCLCANTKLSVGRYGNPLLEGPLKLDGVAQFYDQVACGMKSQPVVFKSVIETIRDQLKDEAAKQAEQAALGAPLHAIREGTLSADRRYSFTLGEWVVTDDFAAPKVAAAVQVAQALQAYLEARSLQRPEASKRRTHTLVLDQQYRALHGTYDRARFQRLIPRYSLFAVLLAHLDEQGVVQLNEEAPARLPITAKDLAGIAEQLSDLLALTEETLMDYAGCSERDAAAHLTAHYAFNGELWIEPGAYYVGHAFEKSEQARRQAEQESGHRRVALLRQADLFISKVKRVSLSDLRLSPRDAVIPDVVLEQWVNDYLNSFQDGKPLFAVRRENGAVRFRLRGGAGENGLRARNQVNANKARALEAYLNHKTEVTQVRNAKDLSREQYKAERALAVSEAASTEEQFMSHFGAWLMQSDFVQIIEEAYTQARGAVLRPEGSPRPLNLPDWRGKKPPTRIRRWTCVRWLP